ncbi:hypothetical protein LY78DRAFT_660524 [Colletotrichum sublineola]|nr:hypothetical protein LY78DRAFT_660524 [Colletotrichum sublineola]
MRYSIVNTASIAFLGLVAILSGTDGYPICPKTYQDVSNQESVSQTTANKISLSILAHTFLVGFLACLAEVLAVLGNVPDHLRTLLSTTDFLVQAERTGPFLIVHTILL